MFPAWSRPVLVRVAMLASVSLAILGGLWLVSGSLGQDPQAPQGQVADPPSKPNVAAVDPSKAGQPALSTPKEAALPKAKAASERKEARPISLTDAIGLVEKNGKGEVVKAEKIGAGANAQFNLEVLNPKGARIRFSMNATGKVLVEAPVAGPAGSRQKARERPREGGR